MMHFTYTRFMCFRFITMFSSLTPGTRHQSTFSLCLPIFDEWIFTALSIGSTFICRGVRSDFFLIFISFFYEIPLSKQNSPRWDAAFCGGTSGAMLFAYVPQKGHQA